MSCAIQISIGKIHSSAAAKDENFLNTAPGEKPSNISRPSSRPSTSHQHPPYLSSHKRPSSMFEDRDGLNFPTPTKDSNSWYHPSLEGIEGKWGRKAAKGARWLRKGKLAAWGPGMEEWEADERARKRIKSLLPLDNRSPSPPVLTHLRSPSPPLIAPYVTLPAQHLDYTSFVMDKGVTHSFRSLMLEDLERATNRLIEGEAGMKQAFGRLRDVLSKDPDQVCLRDAVVPKREDESEDTSAEGEKERRLARAPDLVPPAHKLFIVSYPNGGSPVFDHSQFVHPDMQRENLEKSLSTLRELQDDVREYVERLEEIRESLGDIRAQRDEIWTMELQRIASGPIVQSVTAGARLH
ncbi:hypothetical protein B0F90DRAFT_1807333 [Multifurca ochricompacta]|uniref:Uncharacterized protein n=1 Tax=Multifurca ochricompacta TaxID=376703 RepID=A0AAD4MGF6_9AGAM|nr:hypothetical protein B0F90DRAFT_1807333 [Multifurca ochricompacta]